MDFGVKTLFRVKKIKMHRKLWIKVVPRVISSLVDGFFCWKIISREIGDRVKAIIFDLDNTLIDWKDEFIFALENVLKELDIKLSKEKVEEINLAIDESENHYEKLTKEDFLEFVNRMCKVELPKEFVDKLIEEQKKCSYIDNDVKDTLKEKVFKYLEDIDNNDK